MKHLYAIITSVAGMLTLATSCSVNEMDTYENDPAIYFDHETADSVAYSFFTLDSHIPRDTVQSLPVILYTGQTDWHNPHFEQE